MIDDRGLVGGVGIIFDGFSLNNPIVYRLLFATYRLRLYRLSSMNNRYSRQIRFMPLGELGQQKLAEARVAVVGLGATGSAILHSLLRMGIGYLRIIDRDWVEEHNLPRQTLYTEADANLVLPKAIAATKHARLINSSAVIEPLVLDLNADTIDEALHAVDVVLDGGDNLELRYLLNEWCVRERKPWIYSGVLAAHGMSATFVPDGACFRCVFPPQVQNTPAQTCETAGIIAPIVQVMANCAVSEAIKLITNSGTPNPGLLMIDLWNWSFDQFPLPPRKPDCMVCGKREWQLLEQDQTTSAALCGRDAVQIRPSHAQQIDLAYFAQQLASANIPVQANEYLVRFAADAYRVTLFSDGRAIISGTDNEAIARSVYARWVGV